MRGLILRFKSMGLEKESIREELLKAIKFDRENPINYIKLSIYYLSIDDLFEGMKFLKSALILTPDDENLWFLQGYIYETKKKFKNALEAYYYAYRFGSRAAKQKLIGFCNNKNINTLDKETQKSILKFKRIIQK